MIDFYFRIRENLGVKFLIECPDDITDEEKTNIYAKLSFSCIPALNEGNTFYLSNICLDTLGGILCGDLKRYPRIVILYDNCYDDKIYNVKLDDLPDYDGDVLDMQYGELVLYVDSRNHVMIKGVTEDNNATSYECAIMDGNGNLRSISLLENDNSKSPYVVFAKHFLNLLNEIKDRKSCDKAKKRLL